MVPRNPKEESQISVELPSSIFLGLFWSVILMSIFNCLLVLLEPATSTIQGHFFLQLGLNLVLNMAAPANFHTTLELEDQHKLNFLLWWRTKLIAAVTICTIGCPFLIAIFKTNCTGNIKQCFHFIKYPMFPLSKFANFFPQGLH